MAGLVPAIPIRRAQCPPKRDRRDKPGDDGLFFVIPAEPTDRRFAPSDDRLRESRNLDSARKQGTNAAA
jgi:hypothetical protein